MWPRQPRSWLQSLANALFWLTLLGPPAGGTAAAGSAALAVASAWGASATSSTVASRRSPSYDDLSAPLWLSSPLGAGDVVQAPGDAEATDEEVLLRRELPTAPPARRAQLGLVGQRADLRGRAAQSSGAAPGPLPVMFGVSPPRLEWHRARAQRPLPVRGPGTPVDEFDVLPEGQQLSQTGEELHDMPAATAAAHGGPTAAEPHRFPARVRSLAEVRMRAQCLRFAGWAKAGGAQGGRLADLWRGTCAPAVAAGSASTRYAAMCRALDSAAAGFSSRPGWTPEEACDAVLRVFRESGVGDPAGA
ncbi:unnamed protein product [Prorocentrum cordatum]|uniref:Uncharacterized protein n=1 Tax=Prorocentrum cordatum TaxID=2364126 RepID=A0ABN9UQC7_9DINO|nr:unnamed protein product [Polarella glacialis]